MADVHNPWSEEFWSLTDQGSYIKQYGLSVASRKAKLAKSFIGAVRPMQAAGRIIERQWIITKKVLGSTTVTGGGGGGGKGYSGVGPPS